MALVNEIESVESFVKTLYPASRTEKQQVPLNLSSDTFIIRVQNDSRETDTGSTVVIDREYQIVYVNASLPEVLTKMDAISRAVMDGTLIPINGTAPSTRYIRIEAFSYSAPFQTDNDLYACIGVMQTDVRESRTQDDAPLIGEVSTNVIVIGEN